MRIDGCNGKKCFESKQAARRAVSGRGAKGTFAKLHAYRCERCFYWHLGHRS